MKNPTRAVVAIAVLGLVVSLTVSATSRPAEARSAPQAGYVNFAAALRANLVAVRQWQLSGVVDAPNVRLTSAPADTADFLRFTSPSGDDFYIMRESISAFYVIPTSSKQSTRGVIYNR